jgi:hypothetical protein
MGAKRPEYENNLSPPYNAVDKNAWNFTSVPFLVLISGLFFTGISLSFIF